MYFREKAVFSQCSLHDSDSPFFSHEKGYKIRAKVNGNGGILLTSRLAYVPLFDWTAVAGKFVWFSQRVS